MNTIKTFHEFINEASKSTGDRFEIVAPDTYVIKGTISDSPAGKGTIAKRYDFEYQINHSDSSIAGEKIKTSVVLAMSDDSTGLFTLGKDVEKFCGIPEKEVKKDVKKFVIGRNLCKDCRNIKTKNDYNNITINITTEQKCNDCNIIKFPIGKGFVK